MGREMLTSVILKLKKKNFYRYSSLIFLKMYILRKYYYLTRFLSVKKTKILDNLYNDHKVKPLHITLPKIRSAYVKSYDDKLNRCFFNTIWDKVSGDIKKD